MTRAAVCSSFLLCAAPALLPGYFQGQVGTPDPAQLDEDWYLHTPATFPSIPLEGVTVSVLDCAERCPAPAQSDAAGWFAFPDLAATEARLRFDPPPCLEGALECEPLEPREEVFSNGGRTVLGAKWPAGVEDTALRYMPSVAGAIYIKWEGEIPVLRSCAAAGTWAVVLTEYCRASEYLEYKAFVHELMHVYEFRLYLACWHQRRDVDGWVLQENWLRAVEADRIYRQENGLQWVGERDGSLVDDATTARETLADLAEHYSMPMQLVRNRRAKYPSVPIENYKTYLDMEQYAPNRYAYFEKLVFERYLEEKAWRRENPGGGKWPGRCAAPAFPAPPEQAAAATGSAASRRAPRYPKSAAKIRSSAVEPPPVECVFPAPR